MTLLDFQLKIIITVMIIDFHEIHNVGASPHMGEPHFFFLETIGAIEPLIRGEMCPQNWLFGFHSASMGFFEEKIQSHTRYPISHKKVIFNFVIQHPIPCKIVMPHKNYFVQLFWKILFSFFEKIVT